MEAVTMTSFKSVSVFLKHITGYSLYPVASCHNYWDALGQPFVSPWRRFFVIDYLTNDVHVEGWITLVLLNCFLQRTYLNVRRTHWGIHRKNLPDSYSEASIYY